MRSICTKIIESLSEWWGWIGWALFASVFLTPFFAAGASHFEVIWFTLVGLWLLWWAIDAVAQAVPSWQVTAGVVMVAVGLLPYGSVLTVAAWVIYWTRIRE